MGAVVWPMAITIPAMMCSASLLNPDQVENGRCMYRSGRLSQYAKRQSGEVFLERKTKSLQLKCLRRRPRAFRGADPPDLQPI